MELQLDILGRQVADVYLAFTATIRFGSKPDFELQIEGGLTLRTRSGDVLHAPSNDYSGVASQLEGLVGSTVTGARASEIDGLVLRFDSGISIHVPVDQQYEAWGLVGLDGSRVISYPGGEFGIWSASDGK